MSADLEQPRLVLVIDDEPNIRVMLDWCLRGVGCRVALAATPEDALESASQHRFDLAFLDLRLGAADGLDLLPKLMALQPSLAVVVITAYFGLDSALDAFGEGAVDYIAKPFTPAQIRGVVDRLLPGQNSQRVTDGRASG